MTKAEIADFVCKKLGITEQSTITLAGEFAKARWRMIWNAALWRESRLSATVAVTAGDPIVVLPETFELVTAVRAGTDQMLTAIDDVTALASSPGQFDGPGPVLAFTPINRDNVGRARIQLRQAPAAGMTLLVLGKRKCLDLILGVDTPTIPGADECLCAFVLYDLAQWLRQYEPAEIYKQEANALLQQMKDIETNQATEIRRFIPYVPQLETEF